MRGERIAGLCLVAVFFLGAWITYTIDKVAEGSGSGWSVAIYALFVGAVSIYKAVTWHD